MRFKRGFSHCSATAMTAPSTGNADWIKVASWRVINAKSEVEIFGLKKLPNREPFAPVACFSPSAAATTSKGIKP